MKLKKKTNRKLTGCWKIASSVAKNGFLYSNLIFGEIGNVSPSTHSNRIKIVLHNKIVKYYNEHDR